MPFYLKTFKLPSTKEATFSGGANNFFPSKKLFRSMVNIHVTSWCSGYHYWTSVKPKLKFCAGPNSSCSVSEIHDDEDL